MPCSFRDRGGGGDPHCEPTARHGAWSQFGTLLLTTLILRVIRYITHMHVSIHAYDGYSYSTTTSYE